MVFACFVGVGDFIWGDMSMSDSDEKATVFDGEQKGVEDDIVDFAAKYAKMRREAKNNPELAKDGIDGFLARLDYILKDAENKKNKQNTESVDNTAADQTENAEETVVLPDVPVAEVENNTTEKKNTADGDFGNSGIVSRVAVEIKPREAAENNPSDYEVKVAVQNNAVSCGAVSKVLVDIVEPNQIAETAEKITKDGDKEQPFTDKPADNERADDVEIVESGYSNGVLKTVFTKKNIERIGGLVVMLVIYHFANQYIM